MKNLKKCISYCLIITLLSTLIVSGTASAESSKNYAVSSPIEKLNLSAVSHQSEDGLVEANTIIEASSANSAFGSASAVLDGVAMIGMQSEVDSSVTLEDGTPLNDQDLVRRVSRWATATKEGTHWLKISFDKDVTLKMVKWTEMRKVIGEFQFVFYKDGEKVYTYDGEFTDGLSATKLSLREVDFGRLVQTDEIEFEINSMLNTNIVCITEMEFYGVEGTDGLYSFHASTNDDDSSFSENLEKVFDDNSETIYTANIEAITEPLTIDFDCLSAVISDTIFVGSENIDHLSLFGSTDGETYFEMPYQREGNYYRFSHEYIKSVRIEIYPVEGSEEIVITDIGMYEIDYNDELHSMKAFFEGNDISCITDEEADNITQDLKELPDSLGNYEIEWRSEDSDIVNTETGIVNRTYVDRHVHIYADFIRDNAVYKTNTYKLIIADDGSLEEVNKFTLDTDGVYTNESINILSSDAWDKNGLDLTHPQGGTIETLYDEAQKTSGFSTENINSWLTYPMPDTNYCFETPITIQFDFDKLVVVNNLAIYEYRNRVRKAHLEVSIDGESWTPVTDSVSLTGESTETHDLYLKKIEFPVCYTRHIRFVIDELEVTSKYAAFKLCEFVFFASQTAPLAGQETANAIADRDSSTNIEISHGESLVLDLGSIQGFDSLKWIETGSSIKEYTVSVSNNGQEWIYVEDGTLEENQSITQVNFDYQVARFIKIDVNSIYSDNIAGISEIYVIAESSADEFASEKNLAKLISNDETDILVDEDLLLLSSETVNLPETVGTYTLEWDLSQAPMINESGEVTHGEEDIPGVIGVKVIDTNLNLPVYIKSFPVISKVAYNPSDYFIATSKNNFSGSYDFDKPEGFLFNQENMLVEFTMSDNSVVAVNSDDKLFEIATSDDSITITYKNSTKTISYNGEDVKVRALIRNNQFNLYMNYDNTRYKGVVSGGEYLNDFAQGIKEIESNKEVTDINFGIHKDNIDDFLNQFAFSHISDETMYTVTENLNLFDEIIGLPIVWTSSDDTINPNTGEVDTSIDPQYVVLGLSIDVPEVITWSKELYVAINLPNISTQAITGINAVSYGENSAGNINDGNVSTSFLTSYADGYTIKFTLPERKAVTRCTLIENNTLGSINAYNIYLDGALVYSGDRLNGFEECFLDAKYGTEIKIEITSTEGITGFYEIGIHSEPTNSQRANMDINTIGFAETYAKGEHTLPATSEYGSQLQYTSNKDIVTFERMEDCVKMTVNNPDVDTSVLITVNAIYNGASATKTFSIIAKGDKAITTDPSLGNSGNSGNGGNSGGGSSGGGSKNDLFAGTAPAGDITPYVPEQTADELTGHWGEKEIRTLVEKGIVQGDGNGYNLSSSVSRAEFITMLLRAMGKELSVNETVFDDVSSDSWYADEIQTAYELGWISGYNNNSMPSANITREEMAKIICIATGIEISNESTLDFTDKNEQSAWAVGYINSMYSHNIIKGYEDGSFRPKNSLKRDEAMIIIYRILEKEAK